MQKRFTVINEGFDCSVCGHKNPPAAKTCRNHCRECLHSVHVDQNPGDRLEDCGGILKPVKIQVERGEMANIEFICQRCRKRRKNKLAEDDNREKALEIGIL